jgi:hypothetical protein
MYHRTPYYIISSIQMKHCLRSAAPIGLYDKNSKPQYDLIHGIKIMKEFGIILDLKDKMITDDEVKLSMQKHQLSAWL